jgi:hypothetical protein
MGTHNNFDDSLAKMLKNFGKYFVFLEAKRIETYKQRLSKKSGLEATGRIVIYTCNSLKHSSIAKKQSLEFQKEFRFFLGECEKDNADEFYSKVGNLKPILTEIGSGKVTKPDGTITYFSVGHDDVIKSSL